MLFIGSPYTLHTRFLLGLPTWASSWASCWTSYLGFLIGLPTRCAIWSPICINTICLLDLNILYSIVLIFYYFCPSYFLILERKRRTQGIHSVYLIPTPGRQIPEMSDNPRNRSWFLPCYYRGTYHLSHSFYLCPFLILERKKEPPRTFSLFTQTIQTLLSVHLFPPHEKRFI